MCIETEERHREIAGGASVGFWHDAEKTSWRHTHFIVKHVQSRARRKNHWPVVTFINMN